MSKKDSLKSNESQQKTLLQFWNAKNTATKPKNDQNTRTSNEIILIDEKEDFEKNINCDDDDEDLELIKASDSMMADKTRTSLSNSSSTLPTTSNHLATSSTRSLEENKYEEPLKTKISLGPLASTSNTDTTGYDENSGTVWIYPNNMPIRPYQYNIIQECLHKNTMVVLPTGLGKQKSLILSINSHD